MSVPPVTATVLALAHTPALRQGAAALPLAPLDAALLAWLALEGPTPRARLAALLWPASDAEAGRNSLRQRLFKLRRQAGADLVAGSTMLSLAPGVTHDLADAEAVLGHAPLDLGAEFDDWLERQRGQRRERRQRVLAERCDAAERAGDWTTALSEAEALLALAPHSEPAHRRLVRLHYLAGDRGAALLAFDRLERVLKDEVGTRPGAETMALLRTVEQTAATPAVPALRPQVPAAVLRPPRLVGRAEAWSALSAAHAQGRAALVSGEGGLGKSRLAADFAAAHGAAVVAGARPGDAALAWSSVSRLLRALPPAALQGLAPPSRRELARLLPELGEAPPPWRHDDERMRFFNAVAGLFVPPARPCQTVVFDDLHFADAASVELLRYAIGSAPAGWIVGARAGELSPAAAAWLAEARDDGLLVDVALAPLAEAQVAELVDSLGIDALAGTRDAPALRRRSGGNPQLLLEAVKARLAGADGGALAVGALHPIVERRIAQLSPLAVALARCAAIAVPDFSGALAAHVLQRSTLELADPWAELEAAQVLVDGHFAHDLVHEAARASIPAPVARQLHAEVAAFLAAQGGEPARLAQHWSAAGRWAEAGAAARAAADRARDACRISEQAALLADAGAAFGRAGRPAERFEALLRRAQVLTNDVLGQAAVQAVDEVAALADDPLQVLQVLQLRISLHMGRSEVEQTLACGREGLAAARAARRPDLELPFAVAVADALCDLRRAAEAVALLEPYAAWARENADLEAHWHCLITLGLALDYADRLRDALQVWDQAMQLAHDAGRRDLVWKALSNSSSTLAKTGHVRRSAQQSEQACQMALDSGEPTVRVHQSRVMLAHRLRDTGRYAEALVLFEEALAVMAEQGAEADRASIEHRLAQLVQQLGQPARAVPLLAAERPGLAPGLAMMRLVHRADLAHQLGRDGLPLMREALTVIDNPDDIYHRIACLFATRLVPPDEGEALATSLAAWASARERLGVALAGHVRAAACALAQGAPRRAWPHAEAALHLAAEREPDSFYLPELWLVAGQAAAALGQAAAAAAHWRAGADWVEQAARRHVPPAFVDSFRRRNAINAELLARAAGAG